jgi:hypothetical protein
VWAFNILAGQLLKDGILIDGDVYSGEFPEGFNDSSKEAVPDVGPIPEGFYTICGPPYSDTEHGPYILRLEPDPDNVMHGRVGFLLHGKPLPPADIRSGSKGCICAKYKTRMRVYQSGDTRLQVISGLTTIDPEIQV